MAVVRKKSFEMRHGKKKEKLRDRIASLTLPEKRSEPSDSLQDYSILLYGKKKIGKTSLVAEFPDTIFLMCEPGGKALSIYQVPVRNWSEFKAYVDLAIKDDRFKTICVDTADYSYDMCMDYVCEKMVIEHPSDEDYGKGWKAVKQEYVKPITKLLHSGKGVIFISHSKDQEFKTRRTESFHKVVSSMSGQAKDVLEGLIDIWVNYDYDGKKRVLIVRGSDEVDAGHRLKNHFKYADGTSVEKIWMGRSAKEAYKNFMDAFNNSMEGGGAKQGEEKKPKLRLKR